jgi:hypothetical protein
MIYHPESIEVGEGASEHRMPMGLRIIFWLIILDFLILTGWVWILAFRAIAISEMGFLIDMKNFGLLMMGYHILLLAVTLIGWGMQITWRARGETGLFMYALIFGMLSLNVAALQLTLIVYGAIP